VWRDGKTAALRAGIRTADTPSGRSGAVASREPIWCAATLLISAADADQAWCWLYIVVLVLEKLWLTRVAVL
jgi:hypothetical protein